MLSSISCILFLHIVCLDEYLVYIIKVYFTQCSLFVGKIRKIFMVIITLITLNLKGNPPPMFFQLLHFHFVCMHVGYVCIPKLMYGIFLNCWGRVSRSKSVWPHGQFTSEIPLCHMSLPSKAWILFKGIQTDPPALLSNKSLNLCICLSVCVHMSMCVCNLP